VNDKKTAGEHPATRCQTAGERFGSPWVLPKPVREEMFTEVGDMYLPVFVVAAVETVDRRRSCRSTSE
jgi:hypothetical protein